MKSSYPSLGIFIAAVYMWWLITTPMFSPRLSFLADWSFEKILAGCFVVSAITGGNLSNLVRPIPILLATLFGWMSVCAILTIYSSTASLVNWWDTYWKLLVFFSCLTVVMKSEQDVRSFVLAVAGILFLYQLYTWFDFLNGGSYVYQQGMKRMKGVWSERGYGSGNAWGYMGLFGIPLSIFCYRAALTRNQRILATCFFISTFLCIIFSGVRGALIASTAYLLMHFWKKILTPKMLSVSALVLLLGFPLLPPDVQHRFTSLIISIEQENMTSSDKIASDSASGRIQGLIDGFRLANRSPVFGYGPSTSAIAAYEMRKQIAVEDKALDAPMQLHNLYGQILAEIGYVGLGIWLILIFTCYFTINDLQKSTRSSLKADISFGVGNLLNGWLFVFLFYGMAGHTLYDFRWLVVFALANSYRHTDDISDQVSRPDDALRLQTELSTKATPFSA